MEVSHYRGHKILNFPFRASPYVVTLPPGRFKFEAWGAAGNNNTCYYSPAYVIGRGGYTKGIIQFDHVQVISIYVGEIGNEKSSFNSAYELMNTLAGGGATDFRLVNSGEEWYNFSSLKSRIMVAGGGGGGDCYKGGDAGGLIGQTGGGNPYYSNYPTGGNQTSGGTVGITEMEQWGILTPYPGKFGISGSGQCTSTNKSVICDGAGSGGGGYYGGGGNSGSGGGGGGSSFISGHEGCIAIQENATDESELLPSNTSIHYSGLFFTRTVLLGGNETMPSYEDYFVNMTGNEHDGYARITYLDIYSNKDSLTSCIQIATKSFAIFLFLNHKKAK